MKKRHNYSPKTNSRALDNSSVQCINCGVIRQYVNSKATYFINDCVYLKSPPMQTINVGNKRLIAVNVPEDSYNHKIGLISGRNLIFNRTSQLEVNKIPSGRIVLRDLSTHEEYRLIGLAKSIAEEQWAGIVQAPDWFWMEWYFMNYVEEEFNCQTATESGLSLLQKHGVDPENTLIIETV